MRVHIHVKYFQEVYFKCNQQKYVKKFFKATAVNLNGPIPRLSHSLNTAQHVYALPISEMYKKTSYVFATATL